MADRSLTAGAHRAIARAEELARQWSHPELLPAHLLWSLLLDESEAFELLTTAGVTHDELKLSDIWNGQYPAAFARWGTWNRHRCEQLARRVARLAAGHPCGSAIGSPPEASC
jgi:hypothetical protein